MRVTWETYIWVLSLKSEFYEYFVYLMMLQNVLYHWCSEPARNCLKVLECFLPLHLDRAFTPVGPFSSNFILKYFHAQMSGSKRTLYRRCVGPGLTLVLVLGLRSSPGHWGVSTPRKTPRERGAVCATCDRPSTACRYTAHPAVQRVHPELRLLHFWGVSCLSCSPI